MNVKDIKDLEKVIKLARRLGVQSMKVDGIELHLGPEPKESIKNQHKPLVVESTDPLAHAQVPRYQALPTEIIDAPDEPSDEDILFYSAGTNQ